ncbi:MAG: glycosyltransferase [Holosporales bacterium]|jgi:glycosyltransferase involved in cell wall biosynthesis
MTKTLGRIIKEKRRYILHKLSGGRLYKKKGAKFYKIPHVYDALSYKKDLPSLQCTSGKKQDAVFLWYVPYWENMWGGGHFTIFRFAHLISKTNKNILYVFNWEKHYKSREQLINEFKIAFGNDHKIEIVFDIEEAPENHVAIATTWESVYHVIQSSKNKKKFYFMQDYESCFYAFGTRSIQANATYELGLHGITGGTWLKQCFESHGGKANNYIFSADRDIFYPKNDLGSEIKRLFFYGRPTTERRCYELGVNILQQINLKFPDIEILVAGLDNLKQLPFKATLLGNLTLKQTGNLYRTCDVGIALSATNLSYIPVELMACGVPVITNNGKNTEWFCKNKINAITCDPFPSAFVDALTELKNSKNLRTTIINGGLATIAETSWEQEAEKITSYIYDELDD